MEYFVVLCNNIFYVLSKLFLTIAFCGSFFTNQLFYLHFISFYDVQILWMGEQRQIWFWQMETLSFHRLRRWRRDLIEKTLFKLWENFSRAFFPQSRFYSHSQLSLNSKIRRGSRNRKASFCSSHPGDKSLGRRILFYFFLWSKAERECSRGQIRTSFLP